MRPVENSSAPIIVEFGVSLHQVTKQKVLRMSWQYPLTLKWTIVYVKFLAGFSRTFQFEGINLILFSKILYKLSVTVLHFLFVLSFGWHFRTCWISLNKVLKPLIFLLQLYKVPNITVVRYVNNFVLRTEFFLIDCRRRREKSDSDNKLLVNSGNEKLFQTKGYILFCKVVICYKGILFYKVVSFFVCSERSH